MDQYFRARFASPYVRHNTPAPYCGIPSREVPAARSYPMTPRTQFVPMSNSYQSEMMHFMPQTENYAWSEPRYYEGVGHHYETEYAEYGQENMMVQLPEDVPQTSTRKRQMSENSETNERKNTHTFRSSTSTAKLPKLNMSVQDEKLKAPTPNVPRRVENQLRLLSGNVEKVLQWTKLKDNSFIMLEVVGRLERVQTGKLKYQKILTVKDTPDTQGLSVIFYEIDRKLPKLTVGGLVKCIGKPKARNTIQAFKVVESTEIEKTAFQRNSFMCNRIVQELNDKK